MTITRASHIRIQTEMTSFLPSPHPFLPPFLFFHSFSPKVEQPKQVVDDDPMQGGHSSRVRVTAQRTELE